MKRSPVRQYSRLLWACLAIGLAGGPARADIVALVRKAGPSIVMIEAVNGGRVTRGAGFVFGARGRIATAFHVVDGAATIRLRFHDGRTGEAHVAAQDAPFDLALLEAGEAAPGPALPFAIASPQTGAPVVAVGFPFGHAFSVTAGIVGGHDRTVEQQTPHGFLQHDAALNPGSSGGPLFNAAGEVVGMNAAIPNGRRTDVGVGFAIPAAVVVRILSALEKDGVVRHGYLGARLRLIDPEIAAALGQPASGAAVEEVDPDGPAHQAGARAGDILLRAEGREIYDLRTIAEVTTGRSPGAKLVIDGSRNNKPLRLEITLGELPRPIAARNAPRAEFAPFAAFGIEIAAGAAKIKTIATGSPADAAGLKPDDVILAVNALAIGDHAQLVSTLTTHGRDRIALLVARAGVGSRYVVVATMPQPFSNSPFEGNREAEGSLPF